MKDQEMITYNLIGYNIKPSDEELNQKLYEAVKSGNTSIVTNYLNERADANYRITGKEIKYKKSYRMFDLFNSHIEITNPTLLQIAVLFLTGDTKKKIVLELLKNGADENADCDVILSGLIGFTAFPDDQGDIGYLARMCLTHQRDIEMYFLLCQASIESYLVGKAPYPGFDFIKYCTHGEVSKFVNTLRMVQPGGTYYGVKHDLTYDHVQRILNAPGFIFMLNEIDIINPHSSATHKIR